MALPGPDGVAIAAEKVTFHRSAPRPTIAASCFCREELSGTLGGGGGAGGAAAQKTPGAPSPAAFRPLVFGSAVGPHSWSCGTLREAWTRGSCAQSGGEGVFTV